MSAPLVLTSLLLAVLVAPLPSVSAAPLEFEGRIEAIRHAVLASRLDGVVTEVRFEGGEYVTAGAALFVLDASDAALALDAAAARRDATIAALDDAEAEARRIETLAERDAASEAQRMRAQSALATARAELAIAEAERLQAELDHERTVIRAPIAGRISRPAVAVGAFLEAEAGAPLARIVQLDPALVAYEVPYADRLRSMEQAGAGSVEALLDAVTIELVLPDGSRYGETGVPQFADAEVDPATGAVTIWAEIANPSEVLRPGMPVRVLSTIEDVE